MDANHVAAALFSYVFDGVEGSDAGGAAGDEDDDVC